MEVKIIRKFSLGTKLVEDVDTKANEQQETKVWNRRCQVVAIVKLQSSQACGQQQSLVWDPRGYRQRHMTKRP